MSLSIQRYTVLTLNINLNIFTKYKYVRKFKTDLFSRDNTVN